MTVMLKLNRFLVLLATWMVIIVFIPSVPAQTNVILSEIMASNSRTLADDDGDFEDWIELYNAGTNAVNLEGWYLKDSSTSWRFPQTNIGPNSFLIVFASNKDRR